MLRLTEIAQQKTAEHLLEDGYGIDATVGNGYDTLFMATKVGECGHIFGFDIQDAALQSARTRLQEKSLQSRVHLYQLTHASLKEAIPLSYHGRIQATMFNLGYLPGSNHKLSTQTQSTLEALQQALDLSAARGIITILGYTGHHGGAEETEQVNHWCQSVKAKGHGLEIISPHSQGRPAPKLFCVYVNP